MIPAQPPSASPDAPSTAVGGQGRRVALTLAGLLLLLMAAPARSEPPIPQGLQCLKAAYPEHICAIEANALVWCDGTRMIYDDGQAPPADYERLLVGGDLRDQMAARYKVGKDYPIPPLNFDPGRVRYQPFFEKMYGDSAKAVSRNLTPVRWMPATSGRKLPVSRVNGVNKKLEAVSAEIEKLPPEIRGKVTETSGTFVWRNIHDTDRLSMHSFAIAVDVGVKHSDFWKWSRPRDGAPLVYRNRFPLEVVEIFERHGVIWGGTWYHYDTMHFEYRPELLAPGCRAP